MERVSRAAWLTVAGAVAVLVLGLLVSGCGGGDDGGSDSANFTGEGYPNGDPSNTRSTTGPIDSSTVSELEEAWSVPINAQSTFGSYASTPIVSKGVVYSQDLESNVQAIDLESGEVLWTKKYESPSHGPNGVVVQDGGVYGATGTGAFGLDQKTGKELWSVELTRNSTEGVDMAPGYHEGLVYVSTVPVTPAEFYAGGGVGILHALDAKTGKKVWSFDTVPKGLWGNPEVNSGGGLWYPPAFDEEGSMYFGTGNPGPIPGTPEFPYGSSRPGRNLYTDSLIKMDAKTGKMDWYYQQTPHDINDWDFQNPPILAEVGGTEAVIGAGKSGFVVALDRDSGKVLWKKAVGKHNGTDDIGLETMNGKMPKKPVVLFPGALGGVISPMATDGSLVFVPVINHSLTILPSQEKTENSPLTGELVALEIDTGKVRWKHNFSSAPFGSTSVVNDLVFATTYEGKVVAFDTSGGRELWETSLPAGTNAGVTVSGDTLITAAGVPVAQGQLPEIVAYRLPGGE
ncbi:MAG TPA: PQQ-binding-like beta-propeller repeat protein [Solirubrobacterales bacterium]|nr:PQQ-binding-like beta-propeller repeat protein [Solirubrobacterales bacterium]